MGGDKTRPYTTNAYAAQVGAWFIPARTGFIFPQIAQLRYCFILKIKAGVNRFTVKAYFMVRVFKDLRMVSSFNL